MNEGYQALGKVRAFTYLIFVFDVLLLFHQGIANLVRTTDTRILYGLIMMVAIQSVISQMYVVKYASEAENIIFGSIKTGGKGKSKKATKASADRQKELSKAMMYAARTRYFILANFIIVALLLLNSLQIHSYIFDKIVVCGGIVLIYFVLKNLTILQRGRFQ